MKRILNYVILAIIPAAAILALIVAIVGMRSLQSGQTQLVQATARIESLNASLLATKGELEKIKAVLAQEKSAQDETFRKLSEQQGQIIQHVSKVEQKLKISPVIEDHLNQPVSAIAVPPVASAATAPAAPANAVVATDPAPRTATVSTVSDKQPGERMQVLKGAIDKFNKK